MKEARYYVGNHIKSLFSGLITCEYEHKFLTHPFGTKQHNISPSVLIFLLASHKVYFTESPTTFTRDLLCRNEPPPLLQFRRLQQYNIEVICSGESGFQSHR